MVRLGIPRPPGVALGDRVVHGWNPDGYAALLGVGYRAAKKFSPAELASRLDRVLEAAQKLTERFDATQMEHVPSERKRTLRDLTFHVFRVGLSFADAVDRAALPEEWFEEHAPSELVTGADVARYGAATFGPLCARAADDTSFIAVRAGRGVGEPPYRTLVGSRSGLFFFRDPELGALDATEIRDLVRILVPLKRTLA